jgi:hypothetical protein
MRGSCAEVASLCGTCLKLACFLIAHSFFFAGCHLLAYSSVELVATAVASEECEWFELLHVSHRCSCCVAVMTDFHSASHPLHSTCCTFEMAAAGVPQPQGAAANTLEAMLAKKQQVSGGRRSNF